MSITTSFRAWLHKLFDGAYYVGVVDADAVFKAIEGNRRLKSGDLHIKWIDLDDYRGGWFADPFILEADEERIVLLAEEYRYATCRGH